MLLCCFAATAAAVVPRLAGQFNALRAQIVFQLQKRSWLMPAVVVRHRPKTAKDAAVWPAAAAETVSWTAADHRVIHPRRRHPSFHRRRCCCRRRRCLLRSSEFLHPKSPQKRKQWFCPRPSFRPSLSVSCPATAKLSPPKQLRNSEAEASAGKGPRSDSSLGIRR